ncbi:TetR/AcrR family transcriptional regulator [Flavobacterium sp. MMLR14_040]|uniref:TetR/AcrR family transcriptional regulator n=1 Tax=Flavobacterium sp. MMLR14_040 TaxID=3093843 RepID=UPI00298FC900|nr:TetR/AcrR family transcriptional regulator [Flavobacterium sp. MMLR14_040]MDW8848592.1 TetR/AcrR family transcriptional regulator [Flavobacterium sp. MMLR14_040]
MAGRPKIFDEQEVISKATQIFWEKGYEAASAEELLKAMGIGKGSFYLFFKGGKKELYEKSLHQFAANLLSGLRKEIAESENPFEYLKSFFMELADSENINKAKGCFMGNALVEMAAKDEYTGKIIAKLLFELEKIFADVIQNSKNKGIIKTDKSAELIGSHLLNLWNGINVTRRMNMDDASLAALIKFNLEMIE